MANVKLEYTLYFYIHFIQQITIKRIVYAIYYTIVTKQSLDNQ